MKTLLQKKSKYTYNDYLKLDEGAPYQLIGGELIMSPSPTPYHQKISLRLELILAEYAVKQKKFGEILHAPIDVYFEDEEVYQPDIIFISNDRLNIIEETRINGAPDLVIEILSENNAYYDLKHKKKIYEKHGVKEYWIVDPVEKNIEIYENINNAYNLLCDSTKNNGKAESKLIKGLAVDSKDIF